MGKNKEVVDLENRIIELIEDEFPYLDERGVARRTMEEILKRYTLVKKD